MRYEKYVSFHFHYLLLPFFRPKCIQNAKKVGSALKNSGNIPSRFTPARKTPGIEPVEEGFGGRTPPIVDGDLLDPPQDGSKGHRAAADTLLDNQINLTTMGNS